MIDFGFPNTERVFARWKKATVVQPEIARPDEMNATAAQGQPPAPPPGSTRKVALVGIHGMGQQLPNETINDLCMELLTVPDGELPLPPPTLRMRTLAGSDTPVSCATLMMPSTDKNKWKAPAEVARQPKAREKKTEEKMQAEKSGPQTEVDVYEVYWAPLTEGVVGLGQTVKFLLRSGLNGLLLSLPCGNERRQGVQYSIAPGNHQLSREMDRAFKGLLMTLCVLLWVLAVHLQFLELAVVWASSFWRGWETCAPDASLLLYSLKQTVPGLVLTFLLGVVARLISGRGNARGSWLSLPVIVLALLLAELPFIWCFVQTQWALLAQGSLAGLQLESACILVTYSEWALRYLCEFALWLLHPLVLIGQYVLMIWHWLQQRLTGLEMEVPDKGRAGISATVLLLPLVLRLLWKFAVQFVGDVAVYVSSNQLNTFFQTRAEIHQRAKEGLRRVYAACDPATGAPEYESVVLVAHSLGTVVVYDAYNALLVDDLAAAGPAGGVGTLNIPDRTALLLTYGSPLDKVQFLFRAHRTQPHEVMSGLDLAGEPMLHDASLRPRCWVSFWSPWDFFSGHLDYYNAPAPTAAPAPPAPQNRHLVHNVQMTELSGDLLAHVHYPNWHRFRETLLAGLGVE